MDGQNRSQENLINGDYAVCQTAIRRHVETDTQIHVSYPYPETVVYINLFERSNDNRYSTEKCNYYILARHGIK